MRMKGRKVRKSKGSRNRKEVYEAEFFSAYLSVFAMWSFKIRSIVRIDHFHNDVNSLEILPGTSLVSISCGFKS